MTARCNICGSDAFDPPISAASGPVCSGCRSSARFRRVAQACACALFETDAPLREAEPRPALRGAGLSDFAGYAELLARLSSYKNTFFHQEPFLDIVDPPAWAEGLDFLIASDVFEHVPPPISGAFAGAARILRPGGVLILSVPCLPQGASQTIEHFPRLWRWRMVELDGTHLIVNKTREGNIELLSSLRFHGGPGETLEFRIFSRTHVVELLERHGFTEVRTFDAPDPRFAMPANPAESVVFLARRAGGS